MQKNAVEMASVLTKLYGEHFEEDSHEQYRLEWGDLRVNREVAKYTK